MTIEKAAPSQEESSPVEDPQVADQALADTLNPDRPADGTPEENTPEVEQQKGPSLAEVTSERDSLRIAEKAAQQVAADARNSLAQAALTRQTEQREAAERAARTEDAKSVEEGDLTASEALARSETRQAEVAKTAATAQKIADYESVITTLVSGGEKVGRESFAAEFAEEFGVDKSALMDPAIKDEHEMKLKARELRVEKQEQDREGTETFDSGQTGVVTRNVDDMSGMEKVLHALNHPPKTNK